MSEKLSHFKCLDGIRGAAALSVVFSHTINNGGFPASDYFLIAEAGVWLFFVLSSFLLTHNLYNHFLTLPKLQVLKTYAIKRFFRIYPLYLLLWLFVYFFPYYTPPSFGLRTNFVNWKSFFLIYSRSIPWTIPVEMQAYLILPLVALLFHQLKEHWVKLFLIFSVLILTHNLMIPFYNSGYFIEYITIFLEGSLAAILLNKIQEFLQQDQMKKNKEFYPFLFQFFSILGDISCWILFFTSIFLAVPSFLQTYKVHIRSNDPVYQTPLFSLLLLFSILSQRSFAQFFEANFLVFCGKISYSLYLTHLFGIWWNQTIFKLEGDIGKLAVLLIDLGIASLLYYQVELRIQMITNKVVNFTLKKINSSNGSNGNNLLPMNIQQIKQKKNEKT